MQKIKLKNGLTVIYQKRNTNSVAIEVMVKVGSNNELVAERGVSHFLEHMVFEGTKKRGSSQEISNEIEKIGGELNAYTSKERTCFFIKVLGKHFDIALDVLSDIMQNPLFREEDIDREKKIVNKEIDLVNDEPRFYQWMLFENNLFDKHPTRLPTYGSKKVIEGLKRDNILDYYNKFYSPNNMVVSIVGNVKDWKKKVSAKFVLGKGKEVKESVVREALAKRKRVKKEKRKIANTYLVLGYKTVPRRHKDSYVLEIINGILGRGQSGWMFQEIRGKRGLAYEVGTQHVAERDYGYFAIYLSTDRAKVELVKKLILEQLEKLKRISDKDLQEAKTFIEGDYFLETEDNQQLADHLTFWEQMGDAKMIEEYVNRTKKVSINDVKRVVNKYFNNYCLAIVEGK
ncbi:insulinase family protein [Candidatus Woesearchaeota archaeon]|nr:insulinase family protein [Candidatus Woesearchaeota archaeon]